MNPTIVIPAYNRPRALQRLLKSLGRAQYADKVRLVIAIDAGGERAAGVKRAAANFQWRHGQKLIITHERPLGLIGNVFFCGDLSLQFGPIVLLEDDLVVSPQYHAFARQALDQFAADERIGGVSLNALWFNGYKRWPFVPYLDDSDLFFLQVAWYQGQVYSQEQWKRFAEWRLQEVSAVAGDVEMHPSFRSFPTTDWFPLKTRYLVETSQTYVYPRQSLSTNFGDRGTHFSRQTDFFQVPMQNIRRRFRFGGMDESIAVYDSFQEILPSRINRLTNKFDGYDYVVDLNASRALDGVKNEYVLTTRQCHKTLFKFGMNLRPMIANVIEGTPGRGISFCRVEDVDVSRMAELRTEQRLQAYHWRGRPSLRSQLSQKVLSLLTLFDKD